ncbi:MAG: PorV/PorQ family protein [Ignavibacteria bacterium]|nr:PorV/PorQ family protein [Ignavibacteria bacterium]
MITIILFATDSSAQNDGSANTGLSFLKTGTGAKSMAMGEAYSSISDDAVSMLYNPALVNRGKSNVTLSHNISMIDYKASFVGSKFIFGKFGVGIGLIRTGVDDIEVRLVPGAPLEKFNSQNLSLNFSAAYQIYENFSVGITSKLLYEKIYIDEASGVGFDFGTLYRKENLALSFVVANIGSVNELKDVSTKLPTLVRFGGGYFYPLKDFNFIFAAEGFKVLDGGKFHIHTGIEAGYKDFIFLRAGYMTNYENKSLSAGLGFRYKGLTIDYGFIPYSNSFGTGNTFSLGYNF